MYNFQLDYLAGFLCCVQFTAKIFSWISVLCTIYRIFMLLDTIIFFTLLLIHGNLVNFLFTNVNDDDILYLIL
jgi:hypothetical protein